MQMVVTCQMTVILLVFGSIGGVVGPYGDNMKNWRFSCYGNFGDKNHRFHCLLSSVGCSSFPRHLDLALASNKTNERVKT